MIRFTPAAVAALMLTATPVLAQTTRPQAPVQRPMPQVTTPPAAPAASPAPGSAEWLRLRGESYSAAPEAEQDPAVAPSYRYASMGYKTLRDIVDRINQLPAA